MCQEKKGGTRRTKFDDSVDILMWWQEDYIKKSKEGLFKETRNITNNTRNHRTTITTKKMGRKAIVWVSQVANKQNLTREDLGMTESET